MSQLDLKKMASNNNNLVVNNNNNNNNNSASAINHNPLIVNKQQNQLHLQQANINNNNNNNNNVGLQQQKLLLHHYAQGDLDELAPEISLDLQQIIDDHEMHEQELIFSDLVNSSNNHSNGNNGINNGNSNGNNNSSMSSTAKGLQLQQNRMSQQTQGYSRNQLAYMPQAVHTGATYTNNSSDENSSVGSDGTNIKEEPIEPQEYRRLAAAVNGGQFLGGVAQNNQNQTATGGLYQIPPNYASNGSGNTFTTLSAPALHHQGLPHLPGNHLVSLKHKQMMSQRNKNNKHVDKGTDEYRRRRERNNIAVRKSREKAKVRSREVEEKVKALIKEKDALIRRLEEMTSEINLHKQLYAHLIGHNNPEVNNICRNVLSLVSNDHGM